MSSLRDTIEKINQRAVELDFMTSVGMGRRQGYANASLVGRSFDQSPEAGLKTIWDVDTDLTRLTVDTEIFISSTSTSDTSVDVICRVINAEYIEQISIVRLNGRNQVSLGVSGIIVSIALVIGTTAPLGDIYLATSGSLSGGVPTDTTKIQSKIRQGLNVTHNGYVLVPKGKGVALTTFRGNTNSDTKVVDLHSVVTVPISPIPQATLIFSMTSSMIEINFKPIFGTSSEFGGKTTIFPEGSFIEIKGQTDDNDVSVFASYDMIIADIEKFNIA